MKVWYTCKIKSTRETEDGHLKQVTDVYLVDAVSYTEAETRMNDQVGAETPGEWSITHIAKTNFSEVINYEDVDTWFKCKVTYSTVDGDSEKEVKVNTYYLVSASSAKEAYERVEDNLSSMLVPFEIPAVSITNIYDVLPYLKDEPGSEVPDNLKPLAKEFSDQETHDETEEKEIAEPENIVDEGQGEEDEPASEAPENPTTEGDEGFEIEDETAEKE